jgi:hypothetical protein
MPAPASSRRNALLLLPLLLSCCCCCCYGCWPSGDVGLKVTSGERIKICPRVLPCTPCPACMLRPARINTSVRFQELRTARQERTMHTQELGTHKNQELRMRPQELAPRTRPHTSPRTYFLALGRGCLSRGRRYTAGENPRRIPHRPYLVTGPGSRHGLGAQPGIRSLADPCNGFQPG